MEKRKLNKKLQLKKEAIAEMNRSQLNDIRGGYTAGAPCKYMCYIDPEWSSRATGC